MELFDTHFHYYAKDGTPQEYNANISEILKGFSPLERLYTMVVGGHYEDCLEVRKYAESIDNSYFAVGVHPHEAEQESHSIEDFAAVANSPLCKAIGELGLDYFYGYAPKELQKQVLCNFLGLALELKLPAIIHCRDTDNCWGAYEDSYDILSDFAKAGGKMVIHCFSGTPEWAEKFLDLGAYLGVTGIVTFPKAANIRETLKVIPMERLLLETDAPYLAPVPFRGKPNTPGYLPAIAERVAIERGISLEELSSITTKNALKFYNITGKERD